MLTKLAAHEGMVHDPSMNAEDACGLCHNDIVTRFASSLHKNFHGYETLFEERTGLDLEDHPELEEEFVGECGNCHTTCGQCHVSRPNSVRGGLVRGHRFLSVPNQTDQCTACHGSRVGEEYTGSRDGYRADVHYLQAGMNCMGCHSGHELHGDGVEYTTRYEMPDMPRCENCHGDVATANSYHNTHWNQLQCQVCHSQDYKNCNRCHVGGTGLREPSYLAFKMGRNPIAENRDYEYVVLRHIPIAEDTYEPWGHADLSDFSNLPTWKYASPHNIQRWTTRTDTTGGLSCSETCHQTPNDPEGWFLRETDLESMTEAEQEANRPYIVPDSPPPWN